ncbi:MAG: hypothetical protein LJE85_16565 [Gammaproteobacteria bacterium]|jgi:hypothetical protein|nr:hypothetical protein [Gammaproteobacteria bacterium]
MINLGELAHTVQTNCHISDARHAGSYSMCIFLLKMREYFRWENQIPLSQQIEKAAIGEWLLEKEQSWEGMEDHPYVPLQLESGEFDPFDAKQINAELNPLGYVYSSGYGVFNKPHFFLGQLKKTYQKSDVTIYISACEYARDLVAPPAMSLGDTIFIREESLRRMIWEKIEEWQWKQDQDTAMARVLDFYRHEQDVERILDRLCENESHNVLLHEIGEAQAGRLLGREWEDMLNDIPRSQTELQIRAVRDHLADCLSTLPALLETENIPSLHFYFANFTAMRKELFPAAVQAYQHWVKTGELTQLDDIATSGQHYWSDVAKQLMATWRTTAGGARDTAPHQALEKLIQPL